MISCFSASARRAAAAVVWLMGQRRASPPTKYHTTSTARKIRPPLWVTSLRSRFLPKSHRQKTDNSPHAMPS
eukprot:8146157-Pyramimonas_sp.AAC.1